MEPGDIVRIDDDNEWKGLYGVVKYTNQSEAFIFCVQNPCYLYKATTENNVAIVIKRSER